MALKDMVLNIAKGVVQTVAINTAVNGLPELGSNIRKVGRVIKNGGKSILDKAAMRKDIQDFEAAATKTEEVERKKVKRQTDDLETLVTKSKKANKSSGEQG